MSKRTRKDSGEERVTAKSKSMMNLVLRCSETPDVLASTVSENPVRTRCESQLPLSSWTDWPASKNKAVKDAYSSSCSEWSTDKNWSSQEWKSDELMEVRRRRLAQEEWSSAKDAGRILKRCKTRQQQTFFKMVNVHVFDITSMCIHGKELLEILHSIKNTRMDLKM